MILQLYNQVTEFFENVIVKHINKRLLDLLGRCNYILNPLVCNNEVIFILFCFW